MTRSPLTLAASVTAILPGAEVASTAALGGSGEERFDSAVIMFRDGTRAVVQASRDDAGTAELSLESLALRALTPGARALLPFDVASVHAEGPVPGGRMLVVDWLDGYRIDAPDLPAGLGAASSVGVALAAIHALPTSVARGAGLPVRNADESRARVRADVERAIDTRKLPVALASRWQSAVADDGLWGFESTLTLGGATANSFRFQDRDDIPTVTGVLGWHALSVGDPAIDLHWLVGAPHAQPDVASAYADSADRTPDARLHQRARLYAELEFAKWLVHGTETGQDDIVDDAVALLDALVEGLGTAPSLTGEVGTDPVPADVLLRARERALADESATAMQTDAYDPRMLSLFDATDHEDGPAAGPLVREVDLGSGEVEVEVEVEDTLVPDSVPDQTGPPTEPISVVDVEASETDPDPDPEAEAREAERASRAAFQRWTSSSSE